MRRLSSTFASTLLVALMGTVSACASQDRDKQAAQTPQAAPTDDSHAAAIDLSAPANLEDAIHSAQSLREAGKLADATRAFGQLMLLAPDDPRVVGEYGKALAQEGRGEDAAAFLNRAIELDPGEWSYFSALGVAYDEVGQPKDAKLAYQHALLLKPGDASVLNNLALSRMLSGDLADAHRLILQAKAVGGGDEKIERNVALVESHMPSRAAFVAPTQPAAKPGEQAAPAVIMPKQPVATVSIAPIPAVAPPVVQHREQV